MAAKKEAQGTAKEEAKEERENLKAMSRYLEALAKNARANKVVSGSVISALLGGVLKLGEISKTFPQPADLIGNILIFAAVFFIVADICKGGLFD